MLTMDRDEYIKRTNERILESRQKFIDDCDKEEKYYPDERKGLGYKKVTHEYRDSLLKTVTKIWTADMRYTKTDVDKPNYNTQTYYIKNDGEEFMSDEELYRARRDEFRLHSSFDDEGKLKDNRITHLDGFNTDRIFRSK